MRVISPWLYLTEVELHRQGLSPRFEIFCSRAIVFLMYVWLLKRISDLTRIIRIIIFITFFNYDRNSRHCPIYKFWNFQHFCRSFDNVIAIEILLETLFPLKFSNMSAISMLQEHFFYYEFLLPRFIHRVCNFMFS